MDESGSYRYTSYVKWIGRDGINIHNMLNILWVEMISLIVIHHMLNG